MRILLFADIHIGNIKDTVYVYNTITDIIEKEIIFKKTDIVMILGDYFDRLFKVNEEYVSLAINVMSYLIRACSRSNTKIRMIYGTESHEANQYRLFNHHFTSNNVDIKLFNTVTEEVINDKRILYVPEEYMMDKKKFYKKYLYGDRRYDYIFGHGIIIEGMPILEKIKIASDKNEKQVPRFKSGEFSTVGKLTIFGHIHKHMDMGNNVYYLGSLFRNSFGEEEPKYYGIIEDDKISFVENDKAYIYKTYEFDEKHKIYSDINNLIKEIDNIKKNNKDIFDGNKIGKIRIKFNLPSDIDSSFKDKLNSIISNDKLFHIMIQDKSILELNEDDDIPSEYDFVLDNSMDISDKIYSFINKKYDIELSLNQIKKYINEPLEI